MLTWLLVTIFLNGQQYEFAVPTYSQEDCTEKGADFVSYMMMNHPDVMYFARCEPEQPAAEFLKREASATIATHFPVKIRGISLSHFLVSRWYG